MKILKAARFLLSLAAKLDPWRLFGAVVMMLTGYSAAPLAALSLSRFADDVVSHQGHGAVNLAVLAAALLVVQLMGGHFSHLCSGRLYEQQFAELSIELIEIVSRPPGIEHLDDPAFADQVDLIRNSLFGTAQAFESLLTLSGLLLQIAITEGLLISLDPWLVLLPLFAIPSMFLGKQAQVIVERAREQCAEGVRLTQHFLAIATSAPTAKELRLFGTEEEIQRRQEAVRNTITGRMWKGQAASAALRSLGQFVFTIGAGGTILLVVRQGLEGRATIGGLILVITLAVQVNVQVSGALGQLNVLQAAGRTAERLEILRETTRKPKPTTAIRPARQANRVSTRLARGITLDEVSFRYPGSPDLVLDNISLEMPASSTVALVGENGAGKSTLVKLLCGLYTPTRGKILLDGTDLSDIAPEEWRARIGALFQDFSRLEFVMRESIGLGEVGLLHDETAIARAVLNARAGDVVAAVPGGLDGVVGYNYKRGTDLSGGQWQTLALARCLMRDHPLLLVLDEPAAALDATAEHALFQRYASSAMNTADVFGGVTMLISHRFSTVLMADTIAVLDSGKLRECGSHEELLANNALYAELFRLQERAHR